MKPIRTVTTKPQKIIQDGIQKTVKLEFRTYKVASEKDAADFTEVMPEDVAIVAMIERGEATYIYTRRLVPVKFAL